MNLPYFIRVAVCAAIVALVMAGAGLFPAQSVAGQETSPGTVQGAAAIAQLKRDGQYDALKTAMNQARFSVSRMENTPLGRKAWRAPNPVAGYDAYITESGVSIAVNDESYVSLSLQHIGYGKALRAIAQAEINGDSQTISLTRDGGVTEWYVNGPGGLEQGFTLMEAPGMRQAGVPLRLALQVSEGWRPVAREDSQQVTLLNAKGQAVDYGKLAVRDQVGRNIPARLVVDRSQVVIEVEDSDATYPLTIDPTFSLQQKLTAADPEFYDYLGYSVAISGDTLVTGAVYDNVGSNHNQGSAYVFTRTGTAWTFQEKLTANDGLPYDYFGGSVAISGDTVVVGAWAATIGANSGQGSAYVFTRNGGVWTQQQRLTADDGAESDYFGQSVSLSGNTVAIGANGDSTPPHVEQGSVYVFTRSGTVWTQQKKIIASDGDTQDFFGTSVSLSGNTLAIGAQHAGINGNHAQGAVYIFVGSGSFWNPQQKITATDGAKDDYFGWAVSLSGNTLAVGARYDDIGTKIDQGSAYIFTRLGTHWTQQQKLIANDGAAYDLFGYSIALSGDTVAVGAKDDSVGATPLQGSAYVFARSLGGWTQQQKLVAGDGLMWDEFGAAVALNGETLAVGMPGDDTGSILHHGSVYVFLGPPPCAPLAFSPSSLPNGGINTPYQQAVTVTGGTGPYKFTLAGGSPPPGVSLSVFGLLSGTPTAMGDYQFRIIATDWPSGCSASRDYTLTIGSCPTLVLYPQTLPDGTMGTPYNVTLTATGGIAPYKFGLQGSLPHGLSLSNHGVISGTPTIDGDFQFRLMIFDANACSTVREVRMTIIKAEDDSCSTIMLEPPTLPEGMVDKEYDVQLTPTGGREPYAFEVQGALPPGLSLTPEGYLIGTPREDGSFYFRLVISDARGCSRTFECPITILKEQ